MTIQKVLVIGGTGLLGKPVAQQLATAGYQVSIGSRSASKVHRLLGQQFRAVEIDLSNPDSVQRALEGQDAVHLNLPSGPRFRDCFQNEFGGAKAIASVAAGAGIKRLSLISGANVRAEETFPPVHAKWLAEEALRGSGVPWTIWRSSWFMETLTKLDRFGIIGILGSGEVAAHWLAASDLGVWVAKSFQEPRAEYKTFWAFGPKEVAFRDAAEIYRDQCHPLKPIKSAPIWLVSALGQLTGNREMWFGAQMFKFLERDGERGDPTAAIKLFGAMPTTIGEFCRQQLAQRKS